MSLSSERKLSIKYKIGFLFLVILLLFSVTTIFTVNKIITTGVEQAIVEKVRSDLALSKEIIDIKYPGTWKIVEGKLYKGAAMMTGNNEIVDTLGGLTNNTVTIFQGGTRVATNVRLEDGSRAINTTASENVANAVLNRGESYYGEAVVVDKQYQTAYEPIKSPDGQVVGMLYCGVSKEIISQMIGNIYRSLIIVSIIILLLSLIVWNYLFSRMIIRPFRQIKSLMAEVEQGNLTIRMEARSNDEIGELTESINHFINKVNQMLFTFMQNTAVLKKSLNNMFSVAENMTAGSVEMNNQLQTINSSVGQIKESVTGTAATAADTSNYINMNATALEDMFSSVQKLATASEEISASVDQVSGGVEQNSESINKISYSAQNMSASVNSVATAVKEINISLNEVNQNCERSTQITDNAGVRAGETRDIISNLNNSSKQIGKIVGVINDIAEQTKMLALNAAIEAAGAGEAGKGFAVVANEVKELAKQTAEATDEIGLQIENMQHNMNEAVNSVETITRVIEEITDITNTIAAAVTEQSASTGEISKSIVLAAEKVSLITSEIAEVAENARQTAQNIDEASQGLQDITRSINDLSLSANNASDSTGMASDRVALVAKDAEEISIGVVEIAQSMDEISKLSTSTTAGAEETSKAAMELAEVARKMQELISDYQVS